MLGSEPTRSHRVLKGLVALTVVAMAFFAGMLVERLRLDAKREEMLRRYNQVLQQYRDQQMRSEKTIQR
jgi:Na+/H+ antiporter NhaB